jgi:hypothetical protein
MGKTQTFLVAITAINAALALMSCTQLQQARASTDSVLRGSGLEVVDNHGRVRASIKIHPADPSVTMPDGKPQAESVVLRLVNADGGPGVKLALSENNVGLAMIERQGDYIQVFADGVKVTKNGRPRATWP